MTAQDAGWGLDVLMVIVAISFAMVTLRNAVTVVQILVAAYAFRHRVRPTKRPLELWNRYADLNPPVSVIAPCFNEERSIVQSVRALLALQYPEFEIVVVNDGSEDATLEILKSEFGLEPSDREAFAVLSDAPIHGVYESKAFPNLVVIDKANGRKADAVNIGIGHAISPLVCVIDSDSIIEPDGLLRATEPFTTDDGSLMAVGGAIRVVNDARVRGGYVEQVTLPRGWLPRFQLLEYLRSFLTARVAFSQLNMLMLISGAFGIFRRDVLVAIGGYRHDTVGEDFEVVTHIHRHMRERKRPCRVAFVPEVVCWTEVPFDYVGIRNQRTRWEQGALETLQRHRRMLFNPRYGRVGMIALPLVIFEDLLGPPMELVGYLLIPVLWALGLLSGPVALAFFAISVVFGTALSFATLILEELQLRRTPSARDLAAIGLAALFENFGYRQVTLWFRLRGMWKFWRKDTAWAPVPRKGFAPEA